MFCWVGSPNFLSLWGAKKQILHHNTLLCCSWRSQPGGSCLKKFTVFDSSLRAGFYHGLFGDGLVAWLNDQHLDREVEGGLMTLPQSRTGVGQLCCQQEKSRLLLFLWSCLFGVCSQSMGPVLTDYKTKVNHLCVHHWKVCSGCVSRSDLRRSIVDWHQRKSGRLWPVCKVTPGLVILNRPNKSQWGQPNSDRT